MRRLTDILLGATIVGLGAGAMLHGKQEATEEARITAVRARVQQIEAQIRLRAAAGEVEVNARGWPVTVDPAWFDERAPRNLLLSGARPWLEIAPPEHADLEHPPVRVAIDRTTAGFWYNPGNGVVRARVPATVSDARATALYNRINDVALSSIFEGMAAPDSAVADDVHSDLVAKPSTGVTPSDTRRDRAKQPP